MTEPTTAAGRRHLTTHDPAAFRSFDIAWSGVLAIEIEAVAALLDELTEEAFAKALTRIRGAHNNADYETEEGEPCDWCRLAGEQAAKAVREISRRRR